MSIKQIEAELQQDVLTTLCAVFEDWWQTEAKKVPELLGQPFVCGPGCATCCTCNVTMTAVEAQRIIDYSKRQGLELWLLGRLDQVQHLLSDLSVPRQTTNAFAAACLKGTSTESDEERVSSTGHSRSCPFLQDDCCAVYPARPFHCRCFASQVRCASNTPALAPALYLSAATVVLQLIEHLSQGQVWGNMLDVLLAQGHSLPDERREYLQQAHPLPGFLLSPEDAAQLEPLMTALLSARIDWQGQEYSIEDVLNGRV